MNEVEKRMERMKGTSDDKGEELDKVKFQKMISEYKKFKMNSVKHLRFNSVANSAKFGQFETFNLILFPFGIKSKPISGEELRSSLHLVHIYFDTATFDDIERDKKIKMEAQLSLIGGTMGLLTGFSIISGVEIIFFLFRSFH